MTYWSGQIIWVTDLSVNPLGKIQPQRHNGPSYHSGFVVAGRGKPSAAHRPASANGCSGAIAFRKHPAFPGVWVVGYR